MNNPNVSAQANRFLAVLSQAVVKARDLGLSELAESLQGLGPDFAGEAAQEAQVSSNARKRQRFFYPVE